MPGITRIWLVVALVLAAGCAAPRQLHPTTQSSQPALIDQHSQIGDQHMTRSLRRSNSFLGIHFDFHAGDDCTQVGATLSEEMVQQIIDKVHPDYIQCDCKGHPGISSYPTKVGTPAPGFVRDPLRLWRDVTARNGVALYMHYSGVWDSAACKKHPEWAVVDAKGEVSKDKISVFGPYTDELLIPQLVELRREYGVDGVWIDGECWATGTDYSSMALDAWRRSGHDQPPPREPNDPLWSEWLAFHRQGFRDYVRHYVDRLHAFDPRFQITSNWAFSSFMPEPVSIDLDYLSGDYAPCNSVNIGRIEGRSLAPQGKAWDLMAWSFSGSGDGNWTTKGAAQLMQEAAVVISLGGGFQAYFIERRDASVNLWQMDVMAKVAEFCRARQKFCHQAQPVPQVAIFNSSAAYYRASKQVYAGVDYQPMRGMLFYLLDGQNAVEVLSEHHLQGRMAQYGLIVLAQWDYLPDNVTNQLLNYVRGGGGLMLVGGGPVGIFKEHLGVQLEGPAQEGVRSLEWGGYLAPIKANWLPAQAPEPDRSGAVEVFAWTSANVAGDGPRRPAATVTRVGKGLIGAVYFDAGSSYHSQRQFTTSDMLNRLARRLFPQPIVEVEGSPHVDVTVMTKDGRLMVNLVNTAGLHEDASVYTFDHVPPVGPLEVAIRRDQRPKDVTLQPGGRKVKFTYRDGKVGLRIDRLELHDIIVVE